MANPNETEIKPDDLWTGDLVPPLTQPANADSDPKANQGLKPAETGLMVDVYSNE